MKCPYNITTITTEVNHGLKTEVARWDHEDDSRDELFGRWNTTIIERPVMADCLQEECAAWQNGRCVRTG